MRSRQLLTLLSTLAATAPLASGQGDMVVHRMGYSGGNGDAMTYYGQNSGIAAYSIASQSCNIGNVDLVWTSGSGQQHPVISQNAYRLKDRRFEHIGQSWLKHGFCALCESGCGPGVGAGCASVLRVGCADTYGSGLNDGQNGGPKYAVNPTVGDHNHSTPTPTGNNTTRGRLQIAVNDVTPALNVGAQYFIEGNYVHWKDHQNGFALNNATWRTVNFTAGLVMQGNGNSPNHVGESCVYAWKSADSNVVIEQVTNTNEGGAGVSGFYQVASRVWDNGDGTWDYVYAVNNQNSTQGAYSFAVPFGGSAILTDYWFNDVDYHSGEPQDGTDWTHAEGGGAITWTCPQTFAQNPNANAINWCTMYSFGFTANVGPVAGVGELEMFEPGVGSTLTFPLDGPGTGGPLNTGVASCDGSGGNCPCGGTGAVDAGCPNSNSGSGAMLVGSGNAAIGADSFALTVSNAASSTAGLILSGKSDLSPGIATLADSAGLLCVGTQTVRGSVWFTNFSGFVHMPTFAGGSAYGTASNVTAGTLSTYTFWFRDPGTACAPNDTPASDFNFSNAWVVTWM